MAFNLKTIFGTSAIWALFVLDSYCVKGVSSEKIMEATRATLEIAMKDKLRHFASVGRGKNHANRHLKLASHYNMVNDDKSRSSSFFETVKEPVSLTTDKNNNQKSAGRHMLDSAATNWKETRAKLHRAIQDQFHHLSSKETKAAGHRALNADQCISDSTELLENDPILKWYRDQVDTELTNARDLLCGENPVCGVNENEMASASDFKQACEDAGGRTVEYNRNWECTLTTMGEDWASAETYEWHTLNVDFCAHPSCNDNDVIAWLEEQDDATLDQRESRRSGHTVECDATITLAPALSPADQCHSETNQLFDENPALVLATDKVIDEMNEERARVCGDSDDGFSCLIDENEMPSAGAAVQACLNAGGQTVEYNRIRMCTIASTGVEPVTLEWHELNADSCVYPTCNDNDVLARLEEIENQSLDFLEASLSIIGITAECHVMIALVDSDYNRTLPPSPPTPAPVPEELAQCISNTTELFEDSLLLVLARDRVNEEANDLFESSCGDNDSDDICIIDQKELESDGLMREACDCGGGRTLTYNRSWVCTRISASSGEILTSEEWHTLNVEFCVHPVCNDDDVILRLEQNDRNELDNLEASLSTPNITVECDVDFTLLDNSDDSGDTLAPAPAPVSVETGIAQCVSDTDALYDNSLLLMLATDQVDEERDAFEDEICGDNDICIIDENDLEFGGLVSQACACEGGRTMEYNQELTCTISSSIETITLEYDTWNIDICLQPTCNDSDYLAWLEQTLDDELDNLAVSLSSPNVTLECDAVITLVG